MDSNKDKYYEISNNKSLIIRSSDRRGIWINSKRYSGQINIVFRNNKIFVINVLGVEKYLNSVVGSEMPHKWHIEALKAQAIASRTYALKKRIMDYMISIQPKLIRFIMVWNLALLKQEELLEKQDR